MVLSPVLVVVSLLVWLGDRGPVFFRQERVSRGGRIFRIHKFRTMRVANTGSQVTSADDDRITDPHAWRGLNLLGFALMTVRDELAAE